MEVDGVGTVYFPPWEVEGVVEFERLVDWYGREHGLPSSRTVPSPSPSSDEDGDSDLTSSQLQQTQEGTHRSQLRCCPPLSPSDDDCSRSGPGPTTNWLIPNRLLCGAMPVPVEADHRHFASITHFVDLTDQSEPEEFRAECEGRALAAGTTPPTFIRHTIREFSTGSDDTVLAAVSSIMQALVDDPAAVVY
eukprot:COSAG06_NODE_24019_length_675_cov_0.802083_1_plen_191_part_01